MPKRTTLKSARKRAKDQFSRYIRFRDCLKTTGYLESGKCITCGEEKPFDECDAGHFMKATHRKVEFEEDNCRLQCRYCNRFNDGNQYEFGKKLEESLGVERVNWLRAQKGPFPRKIEDYLEIERIYKEKEETLARDQEEYL